MAVYIDENDLSFFQADGFSQDDIQNTVNHYRSSGMSDDLIQNKIDKRLNELKLNFDNSNVHTDEQNQNQPRILHGAVMYTTPKKNVIDQFRECLDWVGKTAMSAYQEGNEQVEVADLEIKNMLGLDKALDKARLNELSNKQPKQYHDFGVHHSSDYIDENITNVVPRTLDAIKKSYIEQMKMLPYMWETIKATGGGVAVGSVGGGVVGGIATRTPHGVLAGARIGGSWAGRISGSMRLAELEGGLARNELRQINEEIISKGGEPLSDAEINMLAIGVGGVNAGLELVSLKQALKTVPGGDKILDYFKNKQVRELATNKAVREQLKGVLANYAGAVTTEMATEMAQEATNIIADETAKSLGKIGGTPLEENVARVLDTGKKTFGAMMFLGGVTSSAKVVTIYTHQGLSKHHAEKLANQMTPEQKEEFIADNMDDLMNSVDEQLTNREVAELENSSFQKMSDIGLDEGKAFSNSKIVGMLAKTLNSQQAKEFVDKMQFVRGETLEGGVSVNVDENGNSLDMNNVPEVAYQSAMYKSPKENFTDFYNQVFEKENEAKQNNSKVQKSYFEYKNGDTTLRVKHDAVNHSDKKHQLSSTEWEDVLNNISNIENAGISNKQFSNDNVALIKIATPSGKYGVTIQFANGTNQIATVFKSTDKGIDKWIEKGSANSSTSEPLTSRDNSHTVAVVGQNPNNIISYVKQKLNPKEFANKNIEKNFGQSVEDLQNGFTDDIKNILAENEIGSDEFEIEDIRLYGSYTTGKNKDTSDLDVIVQYKGSMKEDVACNILNDTNLTITDVNGVERKVDINPINRELSGTIDEHIERMHEIDGAYFQSVNTAGAETSAEISDAQKEWQEKGTDSKYFKTWFGDSKVVDENGKPLVVYHGSLWKFDTFGKSDEFDFSFSPKFAYEYAAQKSFEQALDLSPVLYSVYLKAENPFDFRDEKSVNELLKKIGDKEINFWGNKYSHEQFKDLIMGLSYENTVKNQEVFDKAEVGMAYSRYNEDVEEKMSSVADAKIVYKNKDYFVALDEIDEPRRSPFSSEPAGRVDRDDVYKQVEKLAKDIDFADEYIKKITLNTNLVKTTYEVGKGYVNEYTPYELTVRLRKVDNPKIAKKGAGYDNWSFMESSKVGDTYFLDFLKENGYDGYYKQEKEQLNISVFNPEQIKSVDNRGTFDEGNASIYYQTENNSLSVDKSNYKNFEELENEFSDFIEQSPEDYSIDNYTEALKDFGITKNKPLNINTPIGNVEIREDRFEHIFNGGGDGHLPDKKRYKSINKMILTLKDPTIIVKDITGKNSYIKLFKKDNSTKNQVAIVYNDKNGDFVYTSMPVDKDKKYLLNRINNSTVVYKKGQTRVAKSNSAANDIINDNSQDFNPSNPLFQGADNSIYNLSYDEKKSLAELHEIAKAKHEGKEFLGYFTKTNDKNIIVVMENANASTIIHELAHCYLESLKDFAKTDKRIREKLDAIFDWLGVTDEDNISRDKHEKFARGFEAYVYNGVAPSKNMQTIFTEFKIWLQGVVDYWLNNDDGFKMDHEVKAVFDKIFDDTKNDVEKSEVQKLIDKANAISFNKNKLSDSQKRHKEYAYDIVAIATGKKKQYLKTILESNKDTDKIKKAKENIQFLCENCDDPFSGGNGFLPEWLEFFSDEGVSYGNQETGADAKLATKALNTIIDKTYSLQIDESEALTEINARYDFFLKEYKTKPENRNITFDAWVSWIDSLDEFEQSTYAEKFAYDIDYIERFEKLDKFEQAKETILKSAHDIYISGASSFEQYKQTVMSVFDGLSFLTVADKARLTANILECRNEEFLKARIDSIMDIAKTMDDIHYRKSMLSAIAKELQGTKNIKQNNKTVGKYDYRTNKIFELLRKYQGYSAEFANDVRLEREELIEKAENEGMTFEDKLINAFLQVKADGLTYADTSLIKQVYDDIIKLKIAGKNAKNEIELMNKLNNKEASERVVKILENKEEGNVLEKFYVNTTANWESMLNTFFNKEIKDKYSLIADETKNSVWAFNEKRNFEEAVRKIYGLSKWNFDAEILKNLAETYEFKKNNYDRVTDEEGKPKYVLRRVVPFKMNKMEIILAYMWDKNETLHKRMVNMFGEEQLIDMIDNLSPQDKQLGDLMMKTVNKYYAPANEVFIKKYGLDLPKVSAYFPSVAEREGSLSEIDLFKDFTQKSSSPSAIKNRSTSVYVPMKFANPVAMLYNHIDTMGRFIHMTEAVDKINKVFNTSDIKDFIKNKYGEQAQKEFLQQLVNITYKQNATMRTKQMDIVNEMVSHWTSGNIIGKVSTGIKQLFACLNYSTAMPVDIWTKYFVKALMSPKQTIDYMYNKIGYLQYRYESGSQNEALQQFINNNPVEKWLYQKLERFTKDAKIKNLLKMSTITAPRKIREVLSIFLRLGDMGAIIFGGKPYIDYLINEKGLTEKEALAEFVVETQRTQQSAEISTLSNWQVVASSNPFSKLFMNYKNAQGQFIRKIADSMISFKRGEIDKTQLAKDVFMYGFLQSFLFKVGTSLSILTLLNTGDYDDLLDDIKTSIFDNLSFFHVFGDIGVGIINRFLTGTSYIATSALFGDIVKEILRCCKEDSDIEDFVHALGFFIQVKEGIPANSLVNEAQGLGDIASGDFQKGLIRALGWTEHRAEKVIGE